jgi:hypothetical protein
MQSAVAIPWPQNPTPETVLNRGKPFHTFITCFFTVGFNIILLSFQTKILYIFLISAMPVTCRAQQVLLYFIALILFLKMAQLQSSSLSHSPVTIFMFCIREQNKRISFRTFKQSEHSKRAGLVFYFAHRCITLVFKNLITITSQHSLLTKSNHREFFRRPDGLNSRSLS